MLRSNRTTYSEVITGVNPVTAADLLAYLKSADASENALLTLIADAAVAQVEAYTGMSIRRRTVTFFTDHWPMRSTERRDTWWSGVEQGCVASLFRAADWLELPAPPVAEITSVTSYDETDTGSVWPSDQYYLDNVNPRRRARLAGRNVALPPPAFRVMNGIEVVYEAGYVDAEVPAGLKLAILGVAAYMYAHRGDCGDCVEACGAATALNQFTIMDVVR